MSEQHDIPIEFVEAVESVLRMPSTEGRPFLCRSYVSKPLGTTNAPSPCCFIVGANTMAMAADVGRCIRDILDHIFVAEMQGTIERGQTIKIIDLLQSRALLLSMEEAMDICKEVGVPVLHSNFVDRNEVLTIPFRPEVGFNPAKYAAYLAKVPMI